MRVVGDSERESGSGSAELFGPWEVPAQRVEQDLFVQRVAALDIGKAELVCSVRVPGSAGRRRQLVRTFSTMTRALLGMVDWLSLLRVEQVVMETTGDYWRSPYYIAEAAGLNPILANAADVKHLPGRAKTDVIDAVWLSKLAERGMVRASFVPPAPIRDLRGLTRYRASIVAARTAEKQRVEKLLEDAQVKLSVVASDIFGVSGRAMLQALIDGERNERVLAELALGRMRPKRALLREAFIGRFTDQHAFLLAAMLGNIDRYEQIITEVEQRIQDQIAPFADAAARLCEIPGVKDTTARVLIAEIGTDMSRFPTPAHLTSWARYAPRANQSAGRRGKTNTGHGNHYLAAVLGEAAISAGATDTFLGARYRRLARRIGKPKAQVAIGRSILVIVWHLLNDPDQHFHDLGPDWHDRHVNQARKRDHHLRELQQMGYRVTLQPVA